MAASRPATIQVEPVSRSVDRDEETPEAGSSHGTEGGETADSTSSATAADTSSSPANINN